MSCQSAPACQHICLLIHISACSYSMYWASRYTDKKNQ
ncbi:unnamed protein product [Staurois parvus]|uniref:Uncharacterized protein n=1 Tax=Staurois parvus TaxID=386267 RepID=A0ABN9AL71_9NEOB|nr:unnamed protein product [Staurois parvus]CAI9536175.1 unnamed protein product [Staurois parvus]